MSQEKKFRIHKPELMHSVSDNFEKKIIKNKEAGSDRYAQSEVPLFKGFSRDFENAYSFALELTPESQAQIYERVVDPIRVIAEKNGVQAVYPGAGDIPPHVTLEYAQFIDTNDDSIKKIRQDLEKNIYLDMISSILNNMEFDLDELVISGRDLYICVGEFNSDMYPVFKARTLIEKIFKKVSTADNGNLNIVEYKDIFHSTVARITGLPDESSSLIKFKQNVDTTVGEDIRKQPVSIAVANVFQGSPYEFVVNNGGLINQG